MPLPSQDYTSHNRYAVVVVPPRLAQNPCMRFTTSVCAMSRAICMTALIVAGGCTSTHVVPNEYPFSAPEDMLSGATGSLAWSSMLAKHASQTDELYRCATDKTACRGRLKSFNRAISRADALTPDEQIELVNFYINKGRYARDRTKRLYDEDGHKTAVLRNQWTTLYDFLLKGGDCEDYATAKYFMLRELGFAASALRVVVTYDRRARGYHAVLAVRRPDESIWLLESDNSVKKTSHSGYRYIYALNEHSIWDHRDDYVGPILSQATTSNNTDERGTYENN